MQRHNPGPFKHTARIALTAMLPRPQPIPHRTLTALFNLRLQAAGMVVHPAPGNETGTLVNAVLHHCNLPAYELAPGERPPLTLSHWPGDHEKFMTKDRDRGSAS